MRKKIVCTAVIILFSFSISYSQANCGANVPVFNVDFTGLASGTVWQSNWVSRNDTCCGDSSPVRCVKFIVTTDTNTTGIVLGFFNGAIPPGAVYFRIDCGAPININDTGSIAPGTHEVTICKPGNNFNQYSITSIGTPPDIAGKIYVDINSNCNYDVGEAFLQNIPVNLLDNALNVVAVSYTNMTGDFSFRAAPGTYTLEITAAQAASAGYNLSCPPTGQINVPSVPSLSNYFGLTCVSAAFDLSAHLNSQIFRPGAHGYFYPRISNTGCTLVQPQAKLILADTNITYVTSTITPTFISGDTLIWNVPVSVAGNSYYPLDYVTVDVDTTATIGDTVCATFIVEPVAGDANPANNTVTFCSPIRSSWDPNEKEVVPQGSVPPNTEFTYTLHFQNTGTDTALDVFIIDTINPNLDIRTFQPVFSSHPYTVQIYSGNVARFVFDNIYLPDSNINEPASHGFIEYKIHTLPGLTTGTQITNTAYIYFDFNPAVITNTTLNVIDLFMSVNENQVVPVSIYPNPATKELRINPEHSGAGLKIEKIEIYNVVGRKVQELKTKSQEQIVVDVSSLSPGMYFVKVKTADEETVQKLIVQH
jgi:uncharacterized repeat protein (TIGR01451 family)